MSGDVEKGQGGATPQSAPPPLDLDLDGLERLVAARPRPEDIGEYHFECQGCNATTGLEDYGPADEGVIALCSDCAYGVVVKVPALLAAARERDALAAENATLRAKIAQHNVWHAENQADAARLAAEVERLKGRLERATALIGRARQHVATIETSLLCTSPRVLVGDLDDFIDAAEAHAAAQAAERKGGA